MQITVAQMAPMPIRISFNIQLYNDEIIKVKSKTNVKCQRIYEAVARHMGIQQAGIRCELYGTRLDPTLCLHEYDLRPDDTIDCVLESIGGYKSF